MKILRQLAISALALFIVVGVASAYTVKSGDSMWKIAKDSGISLTQLIANNPQISNPSLIRPGQEINTGGMLGAAIPSTPALIDAYLASGISNTDTSMILSSGVTRLGISLTGYMCFTLDVNTPQVEYVCGTASGATISGLTRGIDVLNPNTTSSSLSFGHRRFASVQVTDYPTLQILSRILNGQDTIPNHLIYSTTTYTYGLNQLVSWDKAKDYTDLVGAGGFTAGNIGLGKTLRANGTSPETLDINTSTANTSFLIENGYFEVATGTGSKIDNKFNDLKTGNNTWTSTNTFNGTTTQIGNLYGNTTNIITLIASTTITGATTPQPVYIATTTGALQLSSASSTATSTYYQFNGFAISNGSNGSSTQVQVSGIVSGFSGLTTGLEYYVSNVGGTISSTQGYMPFKIGIAVSATQLLIQREKKLGTLENATVGSVYNDKYIYGFTSGGSDDRGGCSASIDGNTVISGSGTAVGQHTGATIFVSRGHDWSMSCSGGAGFSTNIQSQNYN